MATRTIITFGPNTFTMKGAREMKLTEKRTPHQIARRIIASGKPFRGKHGAPGFRYGKLKIMLSHDCPAYMCAQRRGVDIYFYMFRDNAQGRSARDILKRALSFDY